MFTTVSCETELGYEAYCNFLASCGQHGTSRSAMTQSFNVCFCDCEEGWYGKSCEFQKSECQGNLVEFLEPYGIVDGPCRCQCVSLGPVDFKPPECASIELILESTTVPARGTRNESSDYFPLNELNSWIYNTLDSVGEVNGEFAYEARDFYIREDTSFKPLTVYIPDSLGMGFDTFPGQQYFEVEEIENDIYTLENDGTNSLFLFHHFTIGDTIIIDGDTSFVYDMGTVSVPAGDFDNCIGVLSPNSSGLILAPEVGMVAFRSDSMIVAELKDFNLFCSYGVSISVENESCPGAGDGQFIMSISGDTSAYYAAGGLNFEWDGPTNIPEGEDPVNLSAGYYFVTISNEFCQTTVDSLMIMAPEAIEITLEGQDDVSCPEGADGSIDVSFSGGTGPLTFSWNEGAYMTEDIADLPAGMYTLNVIDSLGCIESLMIDITEPSAIVSSAVLQDISCYGLADGVIDPSISGGTAGYQYSWNDGSEEAIREDLEPGEYQLMVTDTSSCTAAFSYTISEPDSLVITNEQAELSCNGDSDGLVYVVISGGTPPFSVLWSTGAATDTISALMAGMYSATVTDNKGCVTEGISMVSEPEPLLAVTDSLSDASCNQSTDAYVSLSISGGEGPYDVLWDNGTNGPINEALSAGEYTATVSDRNGCETIYEVTISQPEPLLAVSDSLSNVSCYLSSDGYVSLTISGGEGPYDILWDNGTTGPTNGALGAGGYTASVSDMNGCEITYTVSISEPDALLAMTDSLSDVSCNLSSDGFVSLSISGGEPPYDILWDNGTSGPFNDSLGAGDYTASVFDANGCETTYAISIFEPDELVVSALSLQHVACYGDSDGIITIEIEGGTPSYNYLWSTGDTEMQIANLGSGSYFVTITDSNGCMIEQEAFISQPDSLQLSLTSTDAQTNMADGTVNVEVMGGMPPYTYLWDDENGQTSEAATNLFAGIYTVLVTDANGCTQEASIEVKLATSVTAQDKQPMVKLFPVPASDFIKVALENFTGNVSDVLIYNAHGAKVSSYPNHKLDNEFIDVTDLGQGVYILVLNTDHGSIAKRFIKL